MEFLSPRSEPKYAVLQSPDPENQSKDFDESQSKDPESQSNSVAEHTRSAMY